MVRDDQLIQTIRIITIAIDQQYLFTTLYNFLNTNNL